MGFYWGFYGFFWNEGRWVSGFVLKNISKLIHQIVKIVKIEVVNVFHIVKIVI